jgi:hypothetical protein
VKFFSHFGFETSGTQSASATNRLFQVTSALPACSPAVAKGWKLQHDILSFMAFLPFER